MRRFFVAWFKCKQSWWWWSSWSSTLLLVGRHVMPALRNLFFLRPSLDLRSFWLLSVVCRKCLWVYSQCTAYLAILLRKRILGIASSAFMWPVLRSWFCFWFANVHGKIVNNFSSLSLFLLHSLCGSATDTQLLFMVCSKCHYYLSSDPHPIHSLLGLDRL